MEWTQTGTKEKRRIDLLKVTRIGPEGELTEAEEEKAGVQQADVAYY